VKTQQERHWNPKPAPFHRLQRLPLDLGMSSRGSRFPRQLIAADPP